MTIHTGNDKVDAWIDRVLDAKARLQNGDDSAEADLDEAERFSKEEMDRWEQNMAWSALERYEDREAEQNYQQNPLANALEMFGELFVPDPG
jgi:hypothetical protein